MRRGPKTPPTSPNEMCGSTLTALADSRASDNALSVDALKYIPKYSAAQVEGKLRISGTSGHVSPITVRLCAMEPAEGQTRGTTWHVADVRRPMMSVTSMTEARCENQLEQNRYTRQEHAHGWTRRQCKKKDVCDGCVENVVTPADKCDRPDGVYPQLTSCDVRQYPLSFWQCSSSGLGDNTQLFSSQALRKFAPYCFTSPSLQTSGREPWRINHGFCSAAMSAPANEQWM